MLEDHKRVKKKFIPPLIALGNFADVSWIDKVLPNIVWIAVIHNKYPRKFAIDITNEFIVQVTGIRPDLQGNFGFLSTFEKLNDEDKLKIKSKMSSLGILNSVRNSLIDFLTIYPFCPLKFLFDETNISTAIDINYLIEYKSLLVALADKRSEISVFSLASIIYAMFSLNRLKITRDSSLAEFPKIIDYPQTEISKQIASSMRATINIFFNGETYDVNNMWAKYFWNRGIELEKCVI